MITPPLVLTGLISIESQPKKVSLLFGQNRVQLIGEILFVVLVVVTVDIVISVVVVITASPRHLALKFSQNWVQNSGYLLVVVIVADDVVIVLIIFSKKRIFKIWSKLGQ